VILKRKTMLRKTAFLVLLVCAFSITSFAQLRKVPEEVTASFSKKYPDAEEVVYKDNLKAFHVHFNLNGDKMIAKYNSKGEWKESEKVIDVSSVLLAVKEGVDKSKYFDWQITEAVLIIHPSGTEQYRLKVEKSEIQKKYLFYTKSGRLIRDAITI
jgi:hypothetical protein